MITLTREEAQQVLDALINAKGYIFYNVLDDKGNRYDAAADILRARLSAPEPEPVAWMVYTLDGTSVCVTDNPADFTPEHSAFPIYTHHLNHKFIGLTDKEREEAWNKCDPYYDIDDFAEAIEAKLREKNT